MKKQTDILLRTVADELVDLVRKTSKVSVEEAAKKLRLPIATVQSLVDFLVEERVFGIEYKFTTPYIYLYKENVKGIKPSKKSVISKLLDKEEFYRKAKERSIPYEHIEGLWRKYIQDNIDLIKAEFWSRATEKKVPKEKIEELWKKYMEFIN